MDFADYPGVRADMRSLSVEPKSEEHGRLRLLVTGELNCFTTDLLATGIDRAVADSTCTVIELDIAGVRFLDSAGIRSLLKRRTHAARTGRRLVLSNPTDWVRQILHATGLLGTLGLPEAAALREAAREARDQAATARNVTRR